MRMEDIGINKMEDIEIEPELTDEDCVYYICKTWNDFCAKPGRIMAKYPIPIDFQALHEIYERDKVLIAIIYFVVQHGLDGAGERWEEFLEIAENNYFILGLKHPEGKFPKINLGWLFAAYGGYRGIYGVLNGDYSEFDKDNINQI